MKCDSFSLKFGGPKDEDDQNRDHFHEFGGWLHTVWPGRPVGSKPVTSKKPAEPGRCKCVRVELWGLGFGPVQLDK